VLNYEEQAAGWYSLDRMFNNFYYASDEFFFQPVCTFTNTANGTHSVQPFITKTVPAKM